MVHCTGDIKIKKDKYQHSIEIKLPGKQAVQVGINIRPYWKQTLNLIKKNYHIVIYTASHQAYADAVLDFMDPKKKYFKYRLYRNNCLLVDVDGAKFYVKDLEILNEHYDLKDIVIVDNSVLSFAFHLHNGIPIVPYYDEDKDGSLYVVGLYLIHIFPENDLREANKTQINLDSFLEEAKKQKEEEKNNIIDEEPDSEEDENTQRMSNKLKDLNVKKEEVKINTNANKVDKTPLNIKRLHGRKSAIFPFNHQFQRRETHDYTQQKLISQSKLINMYYEVNDESGNDLQEIKNESNEENKNNETKVNNNINNSDKTVDKATYLITEDGIEIDCKSDLGYNLFEKTNNISDNDSNSDDEIPILKRGYTIIEDDNKNHKNKNAVKGKLKFIRSNFYNKFKI